jgi:hypothetical protein
MFDTLRRDTAICAVLTAAIVAVAAPSLAQGPSEAQKQAVKSACRSDYMAHCSSVQPGGEAALQCLAKNMSSLSPGCQSAVRAVEASVAPKSEPAEAAPKTETTTAKPAAEQGESKPATTTAVKKPSDAQVSAIRSACRGDYPKVCAGVPTGGAPALQCLEKNKSRVSAACQTAVAAVNGGTAPPTSTDAAAPATAGPAGAPAATAMVLRPMRPREELFVIRSACGADIRALCAGVAPGGGRLVECISNRAADLSPACKDVLVPFMAR